MNWKDVRQQIILNLSGGKSSKSAADEAMIWTDILERRYPDNGDDTYQSFPESGPSTDGGWMHTGYASEGESAGAI